MLDNILAIDDMPIIVTQSFLRGESLLITGKSVAQIAIKETKFFLRHTLLFSPSI